MKSKAHNRGLWNEYEGYSDYAEKGERRKRLGGRGGEKLVFVVKF
jgi:hypothetical protein